MKSSSTFAKALEVMRAVRLIGAVTPTNADAERVRLEAAFARGNAVMPEWTYARRDVTGLVSEVLALSRAAREWDEPLRSLYSARIDEMRVELAVVGAVGTVALGGFAAERYRVPPRASRAADALAESFAESFADSTGRTAKQHNAPIANRAGRAAKPSGRSAGSAARTAIPNTRTAEPTVHTAGLIVASDDESDPRSLVSQVRAAIGAARAPFAVRIAEGLGALAATGERTVYVARGRSLCERAARRIALHEVHGHVLPRVRARRAHPIFALGVARGADDQEGLAIFYEEQNTFLDPDRRAELSRRHRAAALMRAGADFVEVTRALVASHASPTDALAAASRVFRGSHGRAPGLGRESVYLTSFACVRAHLAKHAHDERILASGQIAVDAVPHLRQLVTRGFAALPSKRH